MPHNIPTATLAAGDQSDPAWWLECAKWHEGWAEAAGATEQERAYNSAAALACRTFAAMMERADTRAIAHDARPVWRVCKDGEAQWLFPDPEAPWLHPRSLPAAAVAALVPVDTTTGGQDDA